jgi:hypothetical protein
MYRLKMMTAAVVLSTVSAPSHAFMETLILGLTSVTNNLIDSTESVTNNTIDAASDGFQTVATGPGLMADRIGVMADRIGFMADRIVTTEGIMAGLAHKLIDANQAQKAASMPVAYGAVPAQAPAYYAPASVHAYSASNMIHGVLGATYTATTPAAQGYRPGQLSARVMQPQSVPVAQNSCKVAYGVPLKC